jgi:hypothetical protein
MVQVASPVALFLLSSPVGAREREQRGQEQEPRQEVGQASELIGASNRAGLLNNLGNENEGGQRRQVTPDPARQQQLIGPVVELENQTLYVEDTSGAVVPFDVSALRFREQPAEGQEVRVTYQVEEGTDNVAVGIDGAVGPSAQDTKKK